MGRRFSTEIPAVLALVLTLVACGAGATSPSPPPDPAREAWAALDAQDRCDQALSLVTHPDRWPVRCRWRMPGESLHGQAFPPPRGAAPYDDPHVAIYVGPEETPEQLANAIAHELGHMHHTREPAFAAEWLSARGLPPGTGDEVWTEDYAEVFATLFSPPAPRWRAPTPRPTPQALEELRARFFA